MKSCMLCIALILLSGCKSIGNETLSKKPEPGPRPAGLVTMLEDKSGGTYMDMRSVSAYQGNNHLRRFHLINHYIPAQHMSAEKPVYVASSTVINVVNCDTHQRAQFERIYFSQYWGEGDVIAKRSPIGQWQDIPENSLAGIIDHAVCQIDPARLKPEPPKDTRPALLGEFD
ncbi:surface-adhesin E family protein [Mangrovibacter phragmitis]|uniref:surface-adhesin E family protein n=1 Tax=Mangrovibacter phragmitis TaxID=1691903 RepID=UPI00336A4DF0